MSTMHKRFLSVKEAAEYLGLSSHFLYKLVAQKGIPFTRFGKGKAIRFDMKKLEHWIEERSIEMIDWNEAWRLDDTKY